MTPLQSCWTADRLEAVFRKQAADIGAPDFLASHTSMRNLQGDGLFPANLNEERVFEELRKDDSEHTLIVVRGGPGGGKSHLVRWLKLRLDPVAAAENLEIIFVERENSTLRGVIKQIAAHTRDHAEINARLEEGIGRLNQAGLIGRIKDEWAREIDCNQIRAEGLGPNERSVLFNAAQVSWGDLFRSDIARAILEERGGFFERVARQIGVHDTGTDERLPDPDLRVEDLRRLLDFSTKDYKRRGSRAAAEGRDLLEAILADRVPGLVVRDVIRVLNGVMSGVIRATLNISRSDFEQVFRKIRERLYKRDPQTRLVLLIEDLFPFKHLDEALMNALIAERRPEEEIARLTAVVGMTTGYWEDEILSGRAHIAQRVTHHVTVPVGQAVDLDDATGASRFVARYLNVIRQRDATALKRWSEDDPSVSPPSACATCPHPMIRESCLTEFGSIGDGDERVGLFPFTERAAANLAGALRENNLPSPSPRLLVLHAFRPLLKSGLAAEAAESTFPLPATFAVRTLELPDVSNSSLREFLSGTFAEAGALSSAEWLVRAWGDPTTFRTATDVGGVPVGVFNRFGLRLPDASSGEAPASNTTRTESESGRDENVRTGSAGSLGQDPTGGGSTGSGTETQVAARSLQAETRRKSEAEAHRRAEGEARNRANDESRRAAEGRRSRPTQSGFDPRAWVRGESVSDGRTLARRALGDALEHASESLTLSLRSPDRLRPQILYLEGQQVHRTPESLLLPRVDAAADGLAAVLEMTRGSDNFGPSPSSLRHVRTFRRTYGPPLENLLARRECGTNSPQAVACATAWLLLLDGVLRQRVMCEEPPRQWLFWALGTLDDDHDTATQLPGFQAIAQVLGQRTDRPRRQRLRDLWRRLSVVPRGEGERSGPAGFYAGVAALDAASAFVRGDIPTIVVTAAVEQNELLDVQESLAAVTSGFPEAIASLVAASSAARALVESGSGTSVAPWRDTLIALCESAASDNENDALKRNADALSRRLRAWVPPAEGSVRAWTKNLAVLERGPGDVAFWRTAAMFADPAFRELNELHEEADRVVSQVEARLRELGRFAPVKDAFARVRNAAVKLREIVARETRW